VLGLEAVLANGDVVNVGGRTHKNKTGFDFTRLFTGSEGMLAVVTEATLKLLPLPPYRAVLAIGFGSMRAALRTLHAIFAEGFLPCALEVADAFTLAAAYNRTRSPRFAGVPGAFDCRTGWAEEISPFGNPRCGANRAATKPLFVERGPGNAKCEEVWKIRREFSYSLRDTGLTKLNQDIVVPRGRLEDLFRFATQLRKKHSMPIACFGHAGDGNIHVNVMVDYKEPQASRRADAALDDLFRQVIAWKGAISWGTRHWIGQKTVVATGGFGRVTRVTQDCEARARSVRDIESGKVCLKNSESA